MIIILYFNILKYFTILIKIFLITHLDFQYWDNSENYLPGSPSTPSRAYFEGSWIEPLSPSMDLSYSPNLGGLLKAQRTREIFPESWLWQNKLLG